MNWEVTVEELISLTTRVVGLKSRPMHKHGAALQGNILKDFVTPGLSFCCVFCSYTCYYSLLTSSPTPSSLILLLAPASCFFKINVPHAIRCFMRELLLRDFEDLMREAPTTYRSSNRCCRRISLIVMFRLKFGSKGERSAFPESIRPLRALKPNGLAVQPY